MALRRSEQHRMVPRAPFRLLPRLLTFHRALVQPGGHSQLQPPQEPASLSAFPRETGTLGESRGRRAAPLRRQARPLLPSSTDRLCGTWCPRSQPRSGLPSEAPSCPPRAAGFERHCEARRCPSGEPCVPLPSGKLVPLCKEEEHLRIKNQKKPGRFLFFPFSFEIQRGV